MYTKSEELMVINAEKIRGNPFLNIRLRWATQNLKGSKEDIEKQMNIIDLNSVESKFKLVYGKVEEELMKLSRIVNRLENILKSTKENKDFKTFKNYLDDQRKKVLNVRTMLSNYADTLDSLSGENTNLGNFAFYIKQKIETMIAGEYALTHLVEDIK